jgi:hypothetical protein
MKSVRYCYPILIESLMSAHILLNPAIVVIKPHSAVLELVSTDSRTGRRGDADKSLFAPFHCKIQNL